MRACLLLSVLCDLALQGWSLQFVQQELFLGSPSSSSNSTLEKQRVRAGHAVERERQLGDPNTRSFVAQMEEARLHDGKWMSIFSLMRDGRELADTLSRAREVGASIDSVIDPYLQFVNGDERCETTGLRLADIWRYFRLTWSSAYQSSPGRRMHVLVRDRAAPNHPVIGIAALCSAVVQLSVRDEWIGWTPEKVLARLDERITRPDAEYFLETLNQAIDTLYVDDFLQEGLLRRSELARPTAATVRRMEGEAKRSRVAHEEDPTARAHDAWSAEPSAEDWVAVAESPLFRSKRAVALTDLLQTKLELSELGYSEPSVAALRLVLGSTRGRRALSRIIRTAKAQHVGIDMMDISTCGAIAPYNALLGGKLVSLLMMSPEVVAQYRRRYGAAVSLIASGMAGALVRRAPKLVLLGTTSLYGVASSQYNRLRIRASELEGANGDMEYRLLGKTEGFGSFHFSQLTLQLGEEVAAIHHARRRVNSIFGEGVNPKMRKLREAISLVGLPADKVLKHGSPRLVYAVPLATNFREVLCGRAAKPRYLLSPVSPQRGTQAINNFWRRRWLSPRIGRPEVLEAVAAHTVDRPIRHGARVVLAEQLETLPLFMG
jgi:hypothetical protein